MANHRIFIGAGSNLGNRSENLQLAGQLLSPTVKILRASSLYQTEPWGYADQDAFYNLVWEAETSLPPNDLLNYLKQIERRMGREETVRFGPRIIDLDILLYDSLELNSAALTIPHPLIPERRFVLQPLNDLIPDAKHPILDQSWAALLSAAPPMEVVKIGDAFELSAPVLRWGVKTWLMGIVNLTPDSFSGDGLFKDNQLNVSGLIQQAGDFLDHGAEILDLGAESTRPGFLPVSAADEINRLVPAIEALRNRFPNVLISVDTSKAAVADAVLAAGADWINDVGGGIADPDMCSIVRKHNAKIILMRYQPLSCELETIPQAMQQLISLMSNAETEMLKPDQIILDPGLGFGTTPRQNLDLLQGQQELKLLGYPLLVGPSRKSFIGHYLQREVDSRLAGTAAAVAVAALKGADIVRVHDVEFIKDVISLIDLIK